MTPLAEGTSTDPVWSITEDVFAAMVDGEPGHVTPSADPAPAFTDPLHAWVDVDVSGAVAGRVMVSAEAPTARDLARRLLGMGEQEEVDADDVVDALGEVANVVGGNVKALAPDARLLTLTLPTVAAQAPDRAGWRFTHELVLAWRGAVLVLSVAHREDEPAA